MTVPDGPVPAHHPETGPVRSTGATEPNRRPAGGPAPAPSAGRSRPVTAPALRPGSGRSSRGAAWRVAARLARREARGRPARTLLVAVLIAVPVTAMTVAVVLARTSDLTAQEDWHLQWGHADGVIHPSGAPDVAPDPPVDASAPAEATGAAKGAPPDAPGAAVQTIAYHGAGRSAEGGQVRQTGSAAAPDGTAIGPPDEVAAVALRTIAYHEDFRTLRTTPGRRVGSALVNDAPLTDPMVAPTVVVVDGRLPTTPGEVLISPEVSHDLGAGIGASIELARPAPATWKVVGIGRSASYWTRPLVRLAPGTPFPWRAGAGFLVDFPDVLSRQFLNGPAGGMEMRPGYRSAPAEDSDEEAAVGWSIVVGAVVLLVAGIVITATFAAGARRQLVTLGQLAANGAGPSVLRRVLFLQGTVAGIAGTALGMGLAGAGLAGLAPYRSRIALHRVDHYTFRPTDLVPIVALGVATATLAALVPARTTARIPVLNALAGRRPLHPVPRGLAAGGAAMTACGLGLLALATLGSGSSNGGNPNVWAFTAILGGVGVLLGACAVSPGYVSVLGPLGARLRGSARLAARGLARQRTRTAAVVSAVCAATALAVAASALLTSANAHREVSPHTRLDEVQLRSWTSTTADDRPHRPAPVSDKTVAEVRMLLPDAAVHHLAVAAAPEASNFRDWAVDEFDPEPGFEPSRGQPHAPYVLGGGAVTIADDTFMRLYEPSPGVRQALRDDGAVLLTEPPGRASLILMTPPSDRVPPIAPRPKLSVQVIDRTENPIGDLPGLVVTPEKADALGFVPVDGPVIIRTPHALSADQRDAIDGYTQDVVSEDRDSTAAALMLTTADQPEPVAPDATEAALAALALLASLLVVAASLALSAAETRDERDVLLAVGARPQTMRAASGYRAVLLTAMGTALAMPVGLLPVLVFTTAGDHFPFVLPWGTVLVLVAGVPLVAGLVTTAVSGAALRLRPARLSTLQLQ